MDTRADTGRPVLTLSDVKTAPCSFISPGGATSAVDPLEVSAQIRRTRRPTSGLSPVLGCRGTADPLVRVANDKCEGSEKVLCEPAALFRSQEAAQPARQESDEKKGEWTPWPRPLPLLSNQLPLLLIAPEYINYLFTVTFALIIDK